MTEEKKPLPFFVGEHVALDFLNSIAEPKSTEYDWLESGADMVDWLAQADLISAEQQDLLLTKESPAALEQTAKELRVFREDLREFIQTLMQSPQRAATHSMMATLNNQLQLIRRRSYITWDQRPNSEPTLHHDSIVDRASDILPMLSLACAQLLSDSHLPYIKQCNGPTCTMVFLDTTKNHKRRWCTMELCGNRAKVAAYRSRDK